MSYIHLSGVMLTPVNAPASNVPLRFTSQITYGQVVRHADAIYTCGEDGSYDIDLMYGYYTVEAKFEDSYEFLGSTYIDDTFPSDVSLNDLFGHTVVPTNPNLEEMRQLQAEVEQDAQDAAASATDATISAAASQVSADNAADFSTAAEAASEAAAQSANLASLSQIAVQNNVITSTANANSAIASANSAATNAAAAIAAADTITNAEIITSQNAAATNEDAATTTEYAGNAAASADAALASQLAAAESAADAASSESFASIYSVNAAASEAATSASESNAAASASSANAASTSATVSAASATNSAIICVDNAAITNQNATSCAADASTSGVNAAQASQAAINAAQSQATASAAANSASVSATQTGEDRADAVNAASAANASANLAEQYALALSTGVVAKGTWSAAAGYFPPIPSDPAVVEAYRITVEGTLRVNGPPGQPQIYVVPTDLLYWGASDAFWYRVRVKDSITGAFLLEELAPVDGAGSGLDADLLDGYQGADYGKLSSARTWTASQNFQGGTSGISYFDLKDYPEVITDNSQLLNGKGYITGISKIMVTSALGYTPYQESTALSATTGTFSSSIVSSANITAYSDSRIKTDFEIIPNALDKINKLTGYTFRRTDIEIPRQVGLLAQDVREVLPEAVEEDSEGKLSVAYGNITALLIEAIKELQGEIKKLKESK